MIIKPKPALSLVGYLWLALLPMLVAIHFGGSGTDEQPETPACPRWSAHVYPTTDPITCESQYTQISSSDDHICALRVDGKIECWGDDERGQVSGPNEDKRRGFVRVSTNNSNTCGLKKEGSIICWGRSSAWYTRERVFDDDNYVEMKIESQELCAVNAGQEKTCWVLEGEASRVPPKESVPLRYDVWARGENHSCAIDDGVLNCWGDNTSGAVSGPHSLPRHLTIDVVVSDHTTCVLLGGGVTCWGKLQFDPQFELSASTE